MRKDRLGREAIWGFRDWGAVFGFLIPGKEIGGVLIDLVEFFNHFSSDFEGGNFSLSLYFDPLYCPFGDFGG